VFPWRFEDPIGLAELAELAGLSPCHLSHFIKESTGLSFQRNLAAIRRRGAIRPMPTTDRRLIEGAEWGRRNPPQKSREAYVARFRGGWSAGE
jgi:AraC-like DNA-binding protein